jgi:cytochrome bd ubiquinol oxidase subunit II
METFWFVAVALMLTVYVVLDGFDLGAGIIHHVAGKTEAERRSIIRAIGPVWDGNEVWLIAAGGTLFFSFPVLYAVSFSGFYLPLTMVLWLLMLRALGIELRDHVDDPLWRQFWEFTFAGSSAALAMFLGVALGNVIRGVPLGAERVFFEPLWTDFLPLGRTGILDWYTVLTGIVAFAALAVHGANYIALKTGGSVQRRARQVGRRAGWGFTVLVVISMVATLHVRPDMIGNYRAHVWGWLIPLIVVSGLAGMHHARTRQRDMAAFLSFSACLVGMLGGVAFGLYPRVLPSTLDPGFDLTVRNAAAQSYGLQVALLWWPIASALATIYFINLYRSFRGKVTLEGDGY